MDSRESVAARWTAIAALVAIIALQAAYAFYWTGALPPTEVERSWAGWIGTGIGPARSFSVVAQLAATGLAYLAGRRIARDPWGGAGLALSFVLFPPVVATYALATPHASVAVLVLCLIYAATALPASVGGALRIGVPVAVIAVVAIFTLAGPASGVAAFKTGAEGLIAGAILPYAMVWVGAWLGMLALLSPVVRDRLGPAACRGCVAGFACFVLVTFVAPASGPMTTDQMTMGLAYIFPLGILGFIPLIVWVRHVMPTVKAIGAWIAFPVIMYACFWVVLGPVDKARFPYAQRAAPMAQAPR